MTATNILLNLFLRVGFFDLLRTLTPNTLTVLNYHRINDPTRAEFNTYKSNVSATPTQFAKQMDYLTQKYNVVSVRNVVEWMNGKRRLPSNAAIITFDDGYSDNLEHAFPELKARGLPAVIFLTTDYIDSARLFYWDVVAYCFDQTLKNSVDFPFLGKRNWHDAESRIIVRDEWIALLKTLTDKDKKIQVDRLPDILNVSVPDDLFAGLTLTWSDVRYLNENGIEMGSHTASHPILTRVPLEEVKVELEKSKSQIEAEIRSPVVSFAYPNGQGSDFNPSVVDCVRQTGYQVAFTLLSGPTRYSTIKKFPFTIRRVFLSYRDTFPRFAGKLIGLGRLRV